LITPTRRRRSTNRPSEWSHRDEGCRKRQPSYITLRRNLFVYRSGCRNNGNSELYCHCPVVKELGSSAGSTGLGPFRSAPQPSERLVSKRRDTSAIPSIVKCPCHCFGTTLALLSATGQPPPGPLPGSPSPSRRRGSSGGGVWRSLFASSSGWPWVSPSRALLVSRL